MHVSAGPRPCPESRSCSGNPGWGGIEQPWAGNREVLPGDLGGGHSPHTQGAQYGLIKEYGLTFMGIQNMFKGIFLI